VAEGSGEDADEDVAAFWGWDGDLFYYEGFAVLGLLVEVSFFFSRAVSWAFWDGQ
jgi:hypothetical protein